MSVEIVALSNRHLPSIANWQQQIERLGLPLVLPSDGSIAELVGFLPVQLEGAASGFECADRDPAEIMKLYPEVYFGRAWTHALAFHSQGFEEDLAARQAAAAYAKATDGMVFDPQEGTVMSPDQALAVAAQFKADIPKMYELLNAAAAKFMKP